MKRPSFQFYPGDWLKKPALRAVSLAARGLWIDMIAIMAQVEDPYGHLVFATTKDGQKDTLRPILPAVLARMVGAREEDVVNLLDELESFGLFSRTAEGVIFSRRMVKDEKVRESRAAGGFQSEKNPNVPRKKERSEDEARIDGRIPFEGSSGGSPSSSSSSSSKKTARVRKNEPSDEELKPLYLAYPRHTAPAAALKAMRKAVSEIAAADETSLATALGKLHGRIVLYAAQERRKGTAEKYIPYPATWLNDGCFDDESLQKIDNPQPQISAAEEQSLDLRRRREALAQAGAA